MHDNRIQWIYSFIDTLISTIRIAILSHFKKTRYIRKEYDKCILFGNGPSLSDTIKNLGDSLFDYDIIAVNQMATTPLYEKYKPNIYILADPAYWYEKGYEEAFHLVDNLYNAFVEKTNWELQLYMPYEAKIPLVTDQLNKNPRIKIFYYNKTTFTGFKKLTYFIFNRQWGMVRPQNILSSALMLLIYSKYNTIYLAGADSNWSKEIWVDEKNRMRQNDCHYYNEEDHQIISGTMAEQSLSQYYVFKNYLDIEEYSKSKKVKIYNLYAFSFIDAFEKI